jgi:hypothetical protein
VNPHDYSSGGLVEALGLERETLERVAHRTRQWGEAIVRTIDAEMEERDEGSSPPRELERRLREAASLFALAGSYLLLLDAREARNALRTAASHFTLLESSYSHPLAVCAANAEIASSALNSGDDRRLAASDRANVLLSLGWLDIAGEKQFIADARPSLLGHLDRAHSVAETRVGRLRLPLDATLRVISAADAVAHEEAGPKALVASLHDALIRIHDVTSSAAADRFHWRALMSSILPVEPEAAALCAVAMSAAMRHEAEAKVLDRLELPPLALAPLLVGREIARSSR